MKTKDLFEKKNLFHNICFIFAIISLFYLCVRRVDELGNIVNWDEIGYWANAAYIAGYDWSDMIGRFASYYSYGYSIICAALLIITHNSVLAYKLAVLLNGVFIVGSMVLAYIVGISYFGEKYKTEVLFASYAVNVYANTITQSNSAWTECLLIFLYWLMIVLLISLQKKYSMAKCICLGGIAIYAFMVHPRVVPFLIALTVTMLVYFFQQKVSIKQIIFSGVCIGLIFVVLFYFREYIKSQVYIAKNGATMTNTVAAEIPWIRARLTVSGIVDMVKTFFLRFFYWGCTTYLLFFYFLKEKWKEMLQHVRNKNIDIVLFFMLLSMLGIFGVMTIQLSGSGTVQSILYGRYQDVIIGPFFLFGILCFLTKKEEKFVEDLWFLTISMIVLIIGKSIVDAIPIYSDYFVERCNVNMYPYYMQSQLAYDLSVPIWVAIFIFVVAILFRYIRKGKKWYIVLLIVVGLYTYSSYKTSELVINESFDNYLGMSSAYEEIKEMIKNEEDIYYVHVPEFSGSQQLGMWLQFSCYNKRVHVLDSIEEAGEGYVFVPRRRRSDQQFVLLVETDYPAVYENKYLIAYKIDGAID